MNTKPLLAKPVNYGHNAFPDVFLVLACNIEESLMQGGAEPGKDYTTVDLFRLASPFVLARFKEGKLTDTGIDTRP
jgi:hypothetical protein